MKIKLIGEKFGVDNGKIIDAPEPDDAGDINLGEDGYAKYDSSWAFSDEFQILTDEQAEAVAGSLYMVNIPVKDLLGLYLLLDQLTEDVVRSAQLEKI